MPDNSDEDDGAGVVIGILAGIGLGLLGAAIINSLSKTKCPSCGNLVERNAPYCPNCHVSLRW
jgi:hypothetical protein